MYMGKEDMARVFWSRVNILWEGKPLRDLADRSSVDYVLFLNWRTKHRLPDVISSCNIANVLDTTVEFLVSGKVEKDMDPQLRAIMARLKNASELDLDMVRRILSLDNGVDPKEMDSAVGDGSKPNLKMAAI